MLIKDLQQFGFSKNMAAIYLAAFSKPEVKAGEIIRITGLHRNIVYTDLQKLEEKKLITKTSKSGVATYKALSPERLLGELDHKKKLAEQIIEELRLKQTPTTQEIIVYEGAKEVRNREIQMYADAKEGDVIKYLGVSSYWWDVMGEKGAEKIVKLQNKNGVQLQLLSSYIEKREMEYVEKTHGLTEIKVIPNLTSRESETVILHDRITIKTLVEPFNLIEIVNPNVVKAYIEHFDKLWNQKVQTYLGWEEVLSLMISAALQAAREGVKELYCMGGGYGMGHNEKEIKEFYLKVNRNRINVGLPLEVLFYEHHREEAIREMTTAGDKELSRTNMRFLPKEQYSPLQTNIYGDKTIIIMWEDHPTATVYENPQVADGFRKQFKALWGIAKE